MIRLALKIISGIGLLLMIIPSVLFIQQAISEPQVKTFLIIGTVIWFASATFWLGIGKEE